MLQRFLDPAVLHGISSLDLVAKTVVDGFVSGLHRSPDFGFSLEFAEYRAYSPGERWWTASCRGCTVRRTSASAWSLRSIAHIRRATTCGMWTGTCLRGPSAAI